MQTFLQRLVLFSIGAFLVIEIISFGLRTTDLFESYIAGSEIYQSIRKSKQQSSSKKILIGDSVARQLFSNEMNPYIHSLACNRAISMAGHYFLLKNYLEAGNEVDTVFVMSTPFSFRNNLHEIYTYHYFLKPFLREEYQPFFTANVTQQIAKTPSQFLLNSQYILASDWAPPFKKTEQKEIFSFLSPVSKDYLEKLKQLSLEHDFDCVFIPAPTRKNRQKEVEKLDRTELKGLAFEKELHSFLNQVRYLSDDKFMDAEHLHRPFLAETAAKIHQDYFK